MKLNFIIFAILFSSIANANIQLNDTLKCDGNPATKTKEQLQAGGEMFKILYLNGVERISSCLGWTNFGDGDNWYIADKKNGIYSADVKNQKYLGGWKLGAADVCENADTPDCESPWWTGRWGQQEVLEPEIIELFSQYGSNQISLDGETIGCYGSSPLRYGDIEGNGSQELVIARNDNWLIFDIDQKKVTFWVLLNLADWRTAQETLDQLGTENNADNPQYVSKMAFSAVYESKVDAAIKDPGYRGYAKLYVGHFAEEDSNDILVWRKLYKSRLVKDPIKGFEKIRDTYIHYKLVNGEYQKQTTEQSIVRGWLEVRNLTWQKGYPSKSECPGQEGQLIPEMHDPLLNDPDVLK